MIVLIVANKSHHHVGICLCDTAVNPLLVRFCYRSPEGTPYPLGMVLPFVVSHLPPVVTPGGYHLAEEKVVEMVGA